MTFASFAGQQIVGGSISVPTYGMWAGDISLASDATIPDSAPLVLGNLTMQGHVYRQAKFGGSRTCRVIAGVGGWLKVIPKKQYFSNNGINLSLVLKDAALEVGEKVNVPSDLTIGTGYVREEARASRVLRLIAGASWYVDPAGVTQIQAWPSVKVPSTFIVESQDGGFGKVVIATEDYVSWLPGCTFSGPTLDGTFTNGGVTYRFAEDGTFRLEVLTTP